MELSLGYSIAVSDGRPIADNDENLAHTRRIPDGHPIQRSWLQDLGRFLGQNCQPDRTDGLHRHLIGFPMHYHLRATGNHDNSYYLYGYKSTDDGRLRYFRSQEEFIPHLLWLASGMSKPCSCKFCRSPTIGTQIRKPPVVLSEQSAGLVPFRTGEVVWYKSENNWRIGVIRPGPSNTSRQTNGTISIQPFTQPLYPFDPVEKAESDIRPFLAYSVPKLHPALAPELQKDPSQVDWHTLEPKLIGNDAAKRLQLALEASKMGAIFVDHCFTTMKPVSKSPKDVEAFKAIYFGAEQIFEGDPVRIEKEVNAAVRVVLVVKQIRIRDSDKLRFWGDIWSLKQADLNNAAANTEPIPAALKREKEYLDKNAVGKNYDWYRVEKNAEIDGDKVGGRFYETSKLGPLLLANEELGAALASGEVPRLKLNKRGVSEGPDKGRVTDRNMAIMNAVPEGFKL
ncbi:hypothetical protein F5Y15DRAFT_318264 [Xylariaceae sp. FL0016]|nr:hypothetical protein F5Y15DRAFT_318264 [Xylariaceae sp. FL0016]